jgi:hypothetical protein
VRWNRASSPSRLCREEDVKFPVRKHLGKCFCSPQVYALFFLMPVDSRKLLFLHRFEKILLAVSIA